MTDAADDADRAAAVTRLDSEHSLTLARLADLRADFDGMVAASSDSNADDEHDPEGSTIAFERSQLGALIQQAERHLADIEDARRRLAEGRYGSCEECGRPIAPGRLEARPVARSCIDCAGTVRH
jgi:DnaK suppressor protein